jgi:tetratricopeptide (TPR) repeat protein
MRLLSMLVIPALVLGFSELLLRVAGFGYPTSYFLPSTIEGEGYLIPNYRFSYRFFPKEMARVPQLFRIPKKRGEGTYRIFLFGESAALGDPEPSYGMGRQLEVLLEERYSGIEFDVVCVAMTAINSHVILPIARECAKLDGDLWIVYMGNNEMVGPFGAGTVFGKRAPSLFFVRSALALRTTRLGQFFSQFAPGANVKGAGNGRWGGINMFKQNQLRETDSKRMKAYKNFADNLEDILDAAREAGVPVILSTVASNLKDCSPFASLPKEALTNEQAAEWEQLFSAGKDWESRKEFAVALSKYEQAAQIDAEYAELQFRMGTCLIKLSRTEESRKVFQKALDLDALAVRADSRINDIIRSAIERSSANVTGLDAAELLAKESPDEITGNSFFFEHVHLTPEGNFRLAKLLAEQVAVLLPLEISGNGKDHWAHKDTVLRHLGLTVWDKKRLWQTALGRISVPPFTEQSTHPSSVAHFREQLQDVEKGITIETRWRDRNIYLSALKRAPADPTLIGNYAQFLEGTNNREDAIEQAMRFRELLPDLSWPHYYLGALLQREGRFDEARQSYEKALEIRKEFTQAQEALNALDKY